MRKYKYLLLVLALLNIHCDADEFTFIQHTKVKHEDIYKGPDTLTVQSKDCPKCDTKEYCNRNTGKCEAVSQTPNSVKCESLEGKPVSLDKFAWMDKGGPEL